MGRAYSMTKGIIDNKQTGLFGDVLKDSIS
jgi:hypothetical protein